MPQTGKREKGISSIGLHLFSSHSPHVFAIAKVWGAGVGRAICYLGKWGRTRSFLLLGGAVGGPGCRKQGQRGECLGVKSLVD